MLCLPLNHTQQGCGADAALVTASGLASGYTSNNGNKSLASSSTFATPPAPLVLSASSFPSSSASTANPLYSIAYPQTLPLPLPHSYQQHSHHINHLPHHHPQHSRSHSHSNLNHMYASFDSLPTPSSGTPGVMPSIRSWHHHHHQQQQQPSSNVAPVPLILDSLAANKVNMVENLVDTAALIIESIWPSPSLSAQFSLKTPVIPLHIFVKETLRRSRTTLSTLQLALYYIYRVRSQVLAAQERIRLDQIQHFQQHMTALQHGLPPSPCISLDSLSESDIRNTDYFNAINKPSLPLTPPGSNNTTPPSLSPLSHTSNASASPVLAKSEPVGCGRRMFLAALILASKFQQDRTYSNKAWSKISGLPVSEINLNEIAFLALIDYRLFVSQSVFQKWVVVLTEKGKFKERATITRSNNHYAADLCVPSVTHSSPIPRRNSSHISLPSRMSSCITPLSLAQRQDSFNSSSSSSSTPLPSFSVLTGPHQHQQQPAAGISQPSFLNNGPFQLGSAQTEIPLGKSGQSGLFEPEVLPRQQQGMGSYMTHRWVEAQRREFLRNRVQATLPRLPLTSSPVSELDASNGARLTMNATGSDPMWCKSAGASQRQALHAKLAEMKPDFLPSPATSFSPMGMQSMAGSKRRMTESDDVDAERELKCQRRLSVAFLVDL
ncbi:hypothetical protein F5H01DRAFT_333801 [Linnemannia elongata]|nr:hypothetical protein F5H01DRAFT_333801 [Linnemannia elongata]